jgi:plastocyanin
MLKTISIAALIAFAEPAYAQPSTTIVELTNFKFAPAQIQLKANSPTILQLRNGSSGGHNFSAPAFFAAARVDPASAGLIHEGRIEIPAHATVQVALTPAAGQYPLKCTHTLHATFGMKGMIIVR